MGANRLVLRRDSRTLAQPIALPSASTPRAEPFDQWGGHRASAREPDFCPLLLGHPPDPPRIVNLEQEASSQDEDEDRNEDRGSHEDVLPGKGTARSGVIAEHSPKR